MTIEVPDDCEDWVGWILDSFESLEGSFPHRSFLDFDEEWPDWVKAIARELISTLYPAGKFKVSPHLTPAELGAFMGQRIAYFNRLCEPDAWPGFNGESYWLKMSAEGGPRPNAGGSRSSSTR
ncbi:MAG TPA: hypothetical protein VGM54_06625 [Chthoniobacter sp.]